LKRIEKSRGKRALKRCAKRGMIKVEEVRVKIRGAGGKERKGKEREEELVVRFYLVLFGEAKRGVW